MTIVTVLAETHISTSLYCAYPSFFTHPGSKCHIYIYDTSSQTTPHKIGLEIAKIPMTQSYMQSKHKFWHSVQVHNHNLLNWCSAAAISRPHVTSETMIDNKFFCYIDTVWRLLKDDREKRGEREGEREGKGGRGRERLGGRGPG